MGIQYKSKYINISISFSQSSSIYINYTTLLPYYADGYFEGSFNFFLRL